MPDPDPYQEGRPRHDAGWWRRLKESIGAIASTATALMAIGFFVVALLAGRRAEEGLEELSKEMSGIRAEVAAIRRTSEDNRSQWIAINNLADRTTRIEDLQDANTSQLVRNTRRLGGRYDPPLHDDDP